MRIAVIIPARYESIRFKGKPLADICGKPMIQRVYESVSSSSCADDIFVATDDDRIHEAVGLFGGRSLLTSSSHLSGTDRIAEVASCLTEYDLIVNVQGDEPLLPPDMVGEVVSPLVDDSSLMMSSLRRRIENMEDLKDINIVKVVTDNRDFALYFSRYPVPYTRDSDGVSHGIHFKHIGIYCYRREFLMELSGLPASSLEKAEKLEQLRALENGYRIKVVKTCHDTIGVDTPEDLDRVREIVGRMGQGTADPAIKRR